MPDKENLKLRKMAADWLRALATQVEAEPFCNATFYQKHIHGAVPFDPNDPCYSLGPVIGTEYTITFALREPAKQPSSRPDRVRNW
ncbi:hypothetical protein ACHMW6_06280 [Pseudoduganella sp. UC29_106]|uniref:hypothetical protein n=1 Tax=Pseudoduganella sp. UC29_106 TaxID=3374553 RepID=UPI0037575E63